LLHIAKVKVPSSTFDQHWDAPELEHIEGQHFRACFADAKEALMPSMSEADEPILKVSGLKVHFPQYKGVVVRKQVGSVRCRWRVLRGAQGRDSGPVGAVRMRRKSTSSRCSG
ncbi:hypothetical protein ACVOMS_34820, partial [Bradyrhizobium guangxiense]